MIISIRVSDTSILERPAYLNASETKVHDIIKEF